VRLFQNDLLFLIKKYKSRLNEFQQLEECLYSKYGVSYDYPLPVTKKKGEALE